MVEAIRPSTAEMSPPVTRLITFSILPGPLNVALSPVPIENCSKL